MLEKNKLNQKHNLDGQKFKKERLVLFLFLLLIFVNAKFMQKFIHLAAEYFQPILPAGTIYSAICMQSTWR